VELIFFSCQFLHTLFNIQLKVGSQLLFNKFQMVPGYMVGLFRLVFTPG
jgi:hypothetical protein